MGRHITASANGERPRSGGTWLSRQRAVELIEADPYYQANPRQYRLLAWGKALPQFQVLM